MDFLCAGFTQQPDNPLTCSPADDGIIDQYDPLSADGLGDDVQLDLRKTSRPPESPDQKRSRICSSVRS